MTAQDWVAIIGALAAASVAILTAVGAVLLQSRATHRLVNSRMTELLDETRAGALARGRLDGPESPSRTNTEQEASS